MVDATVDERARIRLRPMALLRHQLPLWGAERVDFLRRVLDRVRSTPSLPHHQDPCSVLFCFVFLLSYAGVSSGFAKLPVVWVFMLQTAIFVVVNRLSIHTHFVPIESKQTAKHTEELFYNERYKHNGLRER